MFTTQAPMRSKSVPLWRQLQQVARMVSGVRQGRSLTAQLEGIEPQLRPGVQALSFHALRWLGLTQALREQLVPRQPAPLVDALLCVSLSLLAAPGELSYSEFTLVNQAVEAVKRDPNMRKAAPMMNACLRRFLREQATLVEQGQCRNETARWNHPRWWLDRLQNDHPQHWRSVLEVAQHPAPMVLRVNVQHATAQQYVAILAEHGLLARALSPSAVLLTQALPVHQLPGFSEGVVSVQSMAAQMAAPMLLQHLHSPTLRLLDACAAPGGKTAHLLELAPQAHVTALEVDPVRSHKMVQNLERLELHADVRVADAAAVHTWHQGELFDGVLLDAPCSASGIVRRHPDVRWLRRESDIAQLSATQDLLLRVLWPLVKPNGLLLYCTCSVFRAEGAYRIDSFVANNTDAIHLASPGHLLPKFELKAGSVGDNGECDDGFFYALLQKRAP